MSQNEGGLDRTLRIILGIGLLMLAFIGPKTAWGYIGIIPIITGLMGWCPLYSILGMNTCSTKKL